MRKRFFCILLILLITVSFGIAIIHAEELSENAEETRLFISECDTEKDFSKMENIALYNIPQEEQEAFYEDFTTLQRRTEGEAYVVLPIPYMRSVAIESYYWSGEPLEDLLFEVSCNGEKWEEILFEKEITQEEGKWNLVCYTISELSSGTGFLKIEFPHNSTVWSPLVGKITAELEESRAERIDVQSPSVFAVPRFGTKEYPLTAQVLDQMNLPMEIPVTWTLNEESINQLTGVQLSSEGILIITSEMSEVGEVLINVASDQGSLSAVWKCSLRKALLGDYNEDFMIDESELIYALENYRATATTVENWNAIRLIDIDDDGKIDVYDVAYLAKHQTSLQQEAMENNDEQGRKDSE